MKMNRAMKVFTKNLKWKVSDRNKPLISELKMQ